MPIIPSYDAQSLPSGEGTAPRISPLTGTGVGLIHLGKGISDIAAKFKRAREVTEYNDNMREMRKELVDLRFKFMERTDYDDFLDDFQEASQLMVSKYAERMEGNSMWDSFEPHMDNAILNTEVSVRTMARDKQIDHGRATYAAAMEDSAEDYGRATREEKENLKVYAYDMTDMNVSAGYITRQEAQKFLRDWDYNAMKSDAWYTSKHMDFDEGIAFLQDEKNFPDLKREDRNSFIAEIRRDQIIKKVQDKEKQDKLDDLTYTNLLEQIVSWEDGEGLLPSHRDILDSPISDPKVKTALMGYVDAVGREKNPYLVSDPQTLGDTITDMYLNTGDWDKKRIASLMGAGLSARDTLMMLHEYENLTQERDPKKYSKLVQGIDTLKKAQVEGMFIGKDLKEATDKEIINNYTMHSRALSMLLQRAHAGEDPIEVTREIMRPYVDKKVMGWLDKTWGMVFKTPAYKEYTIREEAIMELQDEGALVTDESINAKIEEIRKREEEIIGEEEKEEPIDKVIRQIKEGR